MAPSQNPTASSRFLEIALITACCLQSCPFQFIFRGGLESGSYWNTNLMRSLSAKTLQRLPSTSKIKRTFDTHTHLGPLIFLFLCSAQDQTQGLTHTWQVLYSWALALALDLPFSLTHQYAELTRLPYTAALTKNLLMFPSLFSHSSFKVPFLSPTSLYTHTSPWPPESLMLLLDALTAGILLFLAQGLS